MNSKNQLQAVQQQAHNQASPPVTGEMVRGSRRTAHSGVRPGLVRVAASARRHLTQLRRGGSVPMVATHPIATYLRAGWVEGSGVQPVLSGIAFNAKIGLQTYAQLGCCSQQTPPLPPAYSPNPPWVGDGPPQHQAHVCIGGIVLPHRLEAPGGPDQRLRGALAEAVSAACALGRARGQRRWWGCREGGAGMPQRSDTKHPCARPLARLLSPAPTCVLHHA